MRQLGTLIFKNFTWKWWLTNGLLLLLFISSIIVLAFDLSNASSTTSASERLMLLILGALSGLLSLEITDIKEITQTTKALHTLTNSVAQNMDGVHSSSEQTKSILKDLNENIESLQDQLFNRRYLGIVKVHNSFPLETFRNWLNDCPKPESEQITILQSFIPNLTDFEDHLREALHRGARVEIFLINRFAPAAGPRGEALKLDVKTVVRQTQENLYRIYSSLNEEDRPRLKVYAYSCLLSVAVYRVGEQFLMSPFLQGKRAVESPTLEISGKQSEYGKTLLTEFNEIRHQAIPIDFSNQAWRNERY